MTNYGLRITGGERKLYYDIYAYPYFAPRPSPFLDDELWITGGAVTSSCVAHAITHANSWLTTSHYDNS